MPRGEGSPKTPRAAVGPQGPQGPQGARHRQTKHQGSLRGSRVGNGWAVTSARGGPQGGPGGSSRKEGPLLAAVSPKLPEPLGLRLISGDTSSRSRRPEKGQRAKIKAEGSRWQLESVPGDSGGEGSRACACERRGGWAEPALRAVGGCGHSPRGVASRLPVWARVRGPEDGVWVCACTCECVYLPV